jgi:hypothetical protein
MRVIGATLAVKNVPMVKEAIVKKFQSIFVQTATMIRQKVVTRSYGTPYADCVQGEECWDIVSTDENS